MSITESIVATLLLLVVAATINLAYWIQHRRKYGDGREKADILPAFSPFTDKYLRLSTLSIGMLSCWLDSSLLLQFLKGTESFVTGGIVVLLAESLFVWSMMTLGRQYSPCYDSFVPKLIVATGPYGYIRHPIYTANVMLIVGIMLLSGTLVLIPNMVILALGYYQSATQEESYLCSSLPEYKEYVRRSGMFFPRLWP